MSPLIVYITRPNSHEIFMGGKRSLLLWVQEPSYSHASRSYECVGEIRYIDRGWSAPHSSGVLARYILNQDNDLLKAIWKEVFWSILPKGMFLEDGYNWADQIIKDDPEFPITNYHSLSDDRNWEGKCNICHKRFLLKVDLRTNSVERIIPAIELRRTSEKDPIQNGWVKTDDCDSNFAVEYWHAIIGLDDIPF